MTECEMTDLERKVQMPFSRWFVELKRRLFGILRWEADSTSFRWSVIADDEEMFVVKCFEINARWNNPEVAFGQFIRDGAGQLTIDLVRTSERFRGRDLASTILAMAHAKNGGRLPDPDYELPGSEAFWKKWRSPSGRKKIEKLAKSVQARTRVKF